MYQIAIAKSLPDLLKMVDALQGLDYQLTEREYDYYENPDFTEEDKKFEYFVSVKEKDRSEAIKRLKATSFSLE